jgi:hypothetical protein
MARQFLQVVLCYSVAEIRAIPHSDVRRQEVILWPSLARYLWNQASTAADDGGSVLASTAEDPCACCGGKGRWIRQIISQGPPGSDGDDGADAFVEVTESKDTTSGTFSTATAYPSWAASILSHSVTVQAGDKILAHFTGTATWAPGNDSTGLVVGISINGGTPESVAYFDTSGLGLALSPGLAGMCLFDAPGTGTYTVALHMSRNGTNAMLAASVMRPLRLLTAVVRP